MLLPSKNFNRDMVIGINTDRRGDLQRFANDLFRVTHNAFARNIRIVTVIKMTERRNATLTTSKAITLDVMDVVRRVEDGQYFRVTSSGKDNKTPASATLDMRQSTVEFFSLPASDE